MAPGPSPSFRSPYRRRRITWSILLLALGSLLYLGTHTETFGSWSLPASLKDIGHSIASSRGRVIADAKAHDTVRLHVQEIHGLMHFVTEYPEKRLDDGEITGEASESVHIDGSQPIDLQAYSPSGDDWQTYTKTLRKKHPLIVFSKSYCPFSKRAKALLASFKLSPAPFVVELDLRSDGSTIQAILERKTGQRTVPNVLLHGDSLGGSDDVHKLNEEGKLKTLLQEAGLKIND